MLLAIASTLALARTSSAAVLGAGQDLAVDVRDAAWKPLGGVPVRLTAVDADDPPEEIGFEREVALVTSDASGRAVFVRTPAWDAVHPTVAWRVAPCVPTAKTIGVEVDPRALPAVPPVLVLPEVGSVVFLLPERPGLTIRLVRASADGDAGVAGGLRAACPGWDFPPGRRATLPRVGLGLELQYEIGWGGLVGTLVDTVKGPTRAGEERVVPVVMRERTITLGGHLVDAVGRPVERRACTFALWAGFLRGKTGASTTARTDASGRFRVEVVARDFDAADSVRGLYVDWIAPPDGQGPQSTLLTIDRPGAPGERELGDVVLRRTDPSWLFYRMGNDELEGLLRTTLASRSRAVGTARDPELQLGEVVKRGGERWKTVLEELDAALLRRKPPDVDDPEPTPPAHDRLVLTALRRLQARRDPLELEIVGPTRYVTRFPELPKLRFRLRNVDPEAVVCVDFGCQDECTRFGLAAPPPQFWTDSGPMQERPRTTALVELPPTVWPRICRHSPWILTDLPPGGSITFETGPGSTFEVVEPAEVLLRLRLGHSNAAEMSGPFDLLSPRFFVNARAAPIRITRAEQAALRADLLAIARDACVKLVRKPWRPDTPFVQPDFDPQDRIFRAGWNAVPVLIDALDDPAVEERHRDWALGLLFDLTGLHQPASSEQTVIGRTCWEDVWPTTRAGLVESDDRGNAFRLPEDASRDSLVARWKRLRAQLDFATVD